MHRIWLPLLSLFVLVGCADMAVTYMNQAISCHKQKEYEKAEGLFRQALDNNAKLPDIFYHRGKLYRDWDQKEDHFTKAIQDFSKAIELKSDYLVAYNQRASVYRIVNQSEDALRDYKKILELEPNNSRSHHSIGLIYKEKYQTSQDPNDFSQAKIWIDKAIEIDPENIGFYRDRAEMYLADKEYQKAIEAYNKVMQLDPNDLRALIDRGIAYFQMDEYDKAYRDFVQCEDRITKYDTYRKKIVQKKNRTK